MGVSGVFYWWRSWLRHCTTNRKVAGSIPDGIIGIFHPSGRTMALGVDSAANIHEYQEYFLVSKGGRCIGLTNLSPSWNPGTLRSYPGPYRNCFGLIFFSNFEFIELIFCHMSLCAKSTQRILVISNHSFGARYRSHMSDPWRWDWHVLPKRQLTNNLGCVTS
jgi:hypothetical protein